MFTSNSLQAIEQAIMNLSKEDAYQLSLWLQNYLDDEWNQQMKQDRESSKLDDILHRVRQDIKETTVKPFEVSLTSHSSSIKSLKELLETAPPIVSDIDPEGARWEALKGKYNL